MIKEWTITNMDVRGAMGREPLLRGQGFDLYAPGGAVSFFYPDNQPGDSDNGGREHFILLDGYVLLRRAFRGRYPGLRQEQLIIRLHREHGESFIQFIKGNFIILLGDVRRGFSLFTDHLGIKKVFYRRDEGLGRFIFSNRMAPVAAAQEGKPYTAGIAVQSLTHHYLGGLTFLENVRYSGPALALRWNGEFSIRSYWDCSELLDLQRSDITPPEMGEAFRGIVADYLSGLDIAKLSVTLTGGLDSRTILSALLSLGKKPYSFTYGHPESPDAVTAFTVSRVADLKHHNHYRQPSAGWFSELAEEIIDLGDTITSIHRAHRLEAVKMEALAHPDTQMVMGGYMGGECIRNFYYDDLIVSPFTRRWLNEGGDKRLLIRESLREKFLRHRPGLEEEVFDLLSRQPGFDEGRELKIREFYLTLQLLAGVHHAQDPKLSGYFVRYPVAVYLDIDFLYLVFSSPFNFLRGVKPEDGKMQYYVDRVKGAELYCYFVEAFSPEIARVPFAKQGHYSAREFVRDSTFVLMAKRAARKFFAPIKGPTNFRLGKWMEDYVRWRLNRLEGDTLTPSLFDLPRAKDLLKSAVHRTKEDYWRKYTDIVGVHLSIRQHLMRERGRNAGNFDID